MKAKYFTANSQEAVEEMALKHFGCNKEELTIDIISGDQEGEELWQILAIKGTSQETRNLDAAYTIFFEEDGVFLEIYEERGSGESLDSNELMHHLSRKKIVDLSITAVQNLMAKGSGRAKIAMTQSEHIYGEDLNIVITGDELEASARLLAPEPNGPVLELEMAKTKLTEADVLHGLDLVELTTLLESKEYGEPHVVARATPPTDGEDGRLIFHFSTDERTGSPREIGGGRVDYLS